MANLMNTGTGKSTPAILDVDVLPAPTEELYANKQLYRYKETILQLVHSVANEMSVMTSRLPVLTKMAVCALDSIVYCFGGTSSGVNMNDDINKYVYIYDSITDKCTSVYLDADCSNCSSQSANNNVYIIGNSYLRQYVPSTNTITTIAGYSYVGVNHISTKLNSVIYFGSGIYTSGSKSYYGKDFYSYDTVAGTRTTLTSITNAAVCGCAAALNGKIYVFGGNSESYTTNTTNIQIYDISANTWTVTTNSSLYARTYCSAIAFNSVIYLIGGLYTVYENSTTYSSWQSQIQVFTPSTGVFTTGNTTVHLITPMIQHTAVLISNRVFILSGKENLSLTNYYTSQSADVVQPYNNKIYRYIISTELMFEHI